VLEGVALPDRPEAELLFDPQTSGGLLAAVAADQAAELVQTLRDAGHGATRIGTITKDTAFSLG